MITLVEIAATRPDGSEAVLRFASAGYCTRRDDTPADTLYLPVLAAAPQMSQSVFADGRTGGAPRRQTGSISIINADGRFDDLLGWAFDGREAIVRIGPDQGRYPDDYPVWLVSTLSGVAVPDSKSLQFLLRDAMAVFDADLLTAMYKGDNIAPNGIEGTEDDLKDRPKPHAYGDCRNVPAVCVNTSKLIYQVNDGPVCDVPAVYDRGNAYTRGADYTSLEDLLASGPVSGTYRVWRSGGLLRVGTQPDVLTADVLEGDTPAERTSASIITRIAARMGHDVVCADDRARLDAAAPGVMGLWLDSETTALDAIDRIAASAGAWVSLDAAGQLRMGQLAPPEQDDGLPVVNIPPYMIAELRILPSRDAGEGLPARRIAVRYGINWTVIDKATIAGVVAEPRRTWLTLEDRVSAWEDEAVTALHPLAAEMTRDTLLVNESDAQAEAQRLATLYGVQRRLYRLTLSRPEASARLPVIGLGACVSVTYPRFGLHSGKRLRVIGVETRAALDTLMLDLWG